MNKYIMLLFVLFAVAPCTIRRFSISGSTCDAATAVIVGTGSSNVNGRCMALDFYIDTVTKMLTCTATFDFNNAAEVTVAVHLHWDAYSLANGIRMPAGLVGPFVGPPTIVSVIGQGQAVSISGMGNAAFTDRFIKAIRGGARLYLNWHSDLSPVGAIAGIVTVDNQPPANARVISLIWNCDSAVSFAVGTGSTNANGICALGSCWMVEEDKKLWCSVQFDLKNQVETAIGAHLHWDAFGTVAAGVLAFETPTADSLGDTRTLAAGTAYPQAFVDAVNASPPPRFYVNVHSDLNLDGAVSGIVTVAVAAPPMPAEATPVILSGVCGFAAAATLGTGTANTAGTCSIWNCWVMPSVKKLQCGVNFDFMDANETATAAHLHWDAYSGGVGGSAGLVAFTDTSDAPQGTSWANSIIYGQPFTDAIVGSARFYINIHSNLNPGGSVAGVVTIDSSGVPPPGLTLFGLPLGVEIFLLMLAVVIVLIIVGGGFAATLFFYFGYQKLPQRHVVGSEVNAMSVQEIKLSDTSAPTTNFNAIVREQMVSQNVNLAPKENVNYAGGGQRLANNQRVVMFHRATAPVEADDRDEELVVQEIRAEDVVNVTSDLGNIPGTFFAEFDTQGEPEDIDGPVY